MTADKSHPPRQQPSAVPRHVAIIMDGNGRWARARGQSRHKGHQAGAQSARAAVESCVAAGVESLTLFAFSTENWRRPASEVRMLMELFLRALESETDRLQEYNVRLNLIGNREAFSQRLQEYMRRAEALTEGNTGLRLNIAASYGGRWDISQAVREIAAAAVRGELDPADIDESLLARHVCLSDLPDPDLFIRTGGEFRISNFLIWQLAYTELYFTDTLWPDFDAEAMTAALAWFAARERRFGRTSEQLGSARR